VKSSLEVICATVSASNACKGEPPLLIQDLFFKQHKAARKFLNEANTIYQTWTSTGVVPKEALNYFATHYPNTWPKLPVVRNAMLQALAESDPLPSPVAPHTGLTEAEQAFMQFPRDMVDPLADVWEDLTPFQEENEDVQLASLLLDEETIAFLMCTNRKRVQLSLERILQHWSVACNVSHDNVTKLLRLLKRHRPVMSRKDYDRLPWTGRTLVKLLPSELEQVPIKPVIARKGTTQVGTYLHYGVVPALYGNSPGNY